MQKINIERLGDFIRVRTGKLDANASSIHGKYPFFTCSEQTLRIDKFSYDCECVLVAGNGDLNVKYYNGKFDAYQRTYILESVNKNVLDVSYLFHFMSVYVNQLRLMSIGGVIKYIKLGNITDTKIPLPPLEEQKRIANILDNADTIRRKRQEALRLTDEFLRSVFLEMFGDPVTNAKGWPIFTLHTLGRVSTGSTPPSSKKDMFGGSIPFITPGDLKGGRVETVRFVTEEGARETRTIRPGATLVCCIGTIGKMGKAKTRSTFNQQINAVEWNEQASDDYGLECLKFFKKIISEKGSSTTLPILNKSSFQNLEIPWAPIELQKQFSQFLKKIEAKKMTAIRLSEESQNLFACLQQQAFSGELLQ